MLQVRPCDLRSYRSLHSAQGRVREAATRIRFAVPVPGLRNRVEARRHIPATRLPAPSGWDSLVCPRTPLAKNSIPWRTTRRFGSRKCTEQGLPSGGRYALAHMHKAAAALRYRADRESPLPERALARTRQGPSDARTQSIQDVRRSEDRALPWSSVRLRPEVNESHWLNTRGAHFVKVPNALRLALEIVRELLQALTPGAHVRFELTLLVIVIPKRELLKSALVPGQLLAHASQLALEGFPKILRLALSTFPQLVNRDRGELLSAWRKRRQKLLDITWRSIEQLPLNRLPWQTPNVGRQRPFQKIERLRLRVSGKRLQRSPSLRWFDPPGRDRHELFVESFRSLAVQ